MDCSEVTRDHRKRECAECTRLTRRAFPASPASMMGPEGWPLDAASAAALVARVIDDVDQRKEEDSAVLLSDLLCAAWPTSWAQDQ